MAISPLMPLPIPGLVGLGSEGSGSASESEPWDVMVGGLRFMLACSPQSPLIRRGADYRSDQVNFTGEAGETALGFWWQRAQTTWHYGAGNPTFDGEGAGDPKFAGGRFKDSVGIDPWTAGEFQLQRDVANLRVVGSTANYLSAVRVAGEDSVAWSEGSTLYLYQETSGLTSGAATGTVKSMCSDGTNLFYVAGTAVVLDPPIGGFTNMYTAGVTGTVFVLRYAKQRLMLGMDNKIYELNPAASALALPSPLFTHPNPEWVWTDIESGPDGIYASGYAGSRSAVYKFELDTTGALPVLVGGITAAEMPEGEVIYCMKEYLGLFLALGTSKGLRVCSYQSTFSGTTIALAAPTIQDLPVLDITGWDRFLYCTLDDAGDGVCGLGRVDLSSEVEQGVFAWARDARANDDPSAFDGQAGSPVGVAMLGDRPSFLVPSVGAYWVSDTNFVESGTLETGKVLFGMTDPKVFQRASITAIGEGTVTLFSGTDTEDADISRFTLDTVVVNNIETSIGSTRGGTVVFKFQLNRASTTTSPKVLAWSAKALPSQAREDQYLLPVRCFDRTENRYGQTEFQYAIEALDEVSDLVQTQRPVLFQTYFGNPDQWRTRLVQVADYEFRQESCENNWGGTLTLSLRTVEGETAS